MGVRCGVVRADAGESGLDDEEGGADEDSDEDEEETLFTEEVVDGSGEGSGVFGGFGGVWWSFGSHFSVASVIQA